MWTTQAFIYGTAARGRRLAARTGFAANHRKAQTARARQTARSARTTLVAQWGPGGPNSSPPPPPPSPPNDSLFRLSRFLQSGAGQLAGWGLVTYLVLSGRFLDWVVALIGLAVLTPVIGIAAFRFWLGRNLVQGECASCGVPQAAIRDRTFVCLNCGQQLEAAAGGTFPVVYGDPSEATIDVEVVENDSDS